MTSHAGAHQGVMQMVGDEEFGAAMPSERGPDAGLLQEVLENNRMHASDLQKGDEAIARCLEAASRAHAKLSQIDPLLSRVAEAAAKSSGGSISADVAAVSGGSGGSAAVVSQPPALNASQSKRKRPPSLRSAGAGAGAGATINGGGGGSVASSFEIPLSNEAAAGDTGAGSKGLKHFSLKVSEKVEGKGLTNYNEVADELVREMAADAAAGLGEGSYDEKNIRRRVYDALNVLEALGMIDKGKRDIRWLGWPPALGQSAHQRLETERNKVAARLAHKVQVAAAVASKAFCLSNLVLRNQDAPISVLRAAQEAGLAAPNPLPLPFMLIHAPPDADIDIHVSDDQRNASLNFHKHPFQIFDDEGVMRMMGLGEPRPELLQTAGAAGGTHAGYNAAMHAMDMGAPGGTADMAVDGTAGGDGLGTTPTKSTMHGLMGPGNEVGRMFTELSPSAGVSAMGLGSPMDGSGSGGGGGQQHGGTATRTGSGGGGGFPSLVPTRLLS